MLTSTWKNLRGLKSTEPSFNKFPARGVSFKGVATWAGLWVKGMHDPLTAVGNRIWASGRNRATGCKQTTLQIAKRFFVGYVSPVLAVLSRAIGAIRRARNLDLERGGNRQLPHPDAACGANWLRQQPGRGRARGPGGEDVAPVPLHGVAVARLPLLQFNYRVPQEGAGRRRDTEGRGARSLCCALQVRRDENCPQFTELTHNSPKYSEWNLAWEKLKGFFLQNTQF